MFKFEVAHKTGQFFTNLGISCATAGKSPGGLELNQCQAPELRTNTFRHNHIYAQGSYLHTGIGEIIIPA